MSLVHIQACRHNMGYRTRHRMLRKQNVHRLSMMKYFHTARRSPLLSARRATQYGTSFPAGALPTVLKRCYQFESTPESPVLAIDVFQLFLEFKDLASPPSTISIAAECLKDYYAKVYEYDPNLKKAVHELIDVLEAVLDEINEESKRGKAIQVNESYVVMKCREKFQARNGNRNNTNKNNNNNNSTKKKIGFFAAGVLVLLAFLI